MKLVYFTPGNSGNKSQGDARICFSWSGIVTLSGIAVEAMKLKIGDKIVIAQDEDRAKDWYIARRSDGFPVRSLKGTKALSMQSSLIAHRMIKQFGTSDKKSVRFTIATRPTVIEEAEYFAILTSAPLR